MAGNSVSMESDKDMLSMLMDLLKELFGAALKSMGMGGGGGGGSGMSMDDVFKSKDLADQVGSTLQSFGENSMIRGMAKAVMETDTFKEMASSFLENNPGAKEFANNVFSKLGSEGSDEAKGFFADCQSKFNDISDKVDAKADKANNKNKTEGLEEGAAMGAKMG